MGSITTDSRNRCNPSCIAVTWGMILTIFSKLQDRRKILHLIFSLNHDDNMPLSLKFIASTSDAIFWMKKVIKHTSAIQPIKDVFDGESRAVWADARKVVFEPRKRRRSFLSQKDQFPPKSCFTGKKIYLSRHWAIVKGTDRCFCLRGLPYMTSAVGGGMGVPKKQTKETK